MPKIKRRQRRYVLCGTAVGSDPINHFRLIAGSNMPSELFHGETALRVNIPNGLKLTKYSCDPYSTTDDPRTLDELGYDFVIWDGGLKRWVVHNEFKGIRPCDISLQTARATVEGKRKGAAS